MLATDDAWIRDYGPIFVKNAAGELACHDFHFNNWGGKYGDCGNDDVVPQHVARMIGVPVWIHDFVLEGGSIEVNGAGTVMTSESCLLGPGRNADMTSRADRSGAARVSRYQARPLAARRHRGRRHRRPHRRPRALCQ